MGTTLPANTTKANFDAGTDDPKQARSELATNADIQNSLKNALGDFAQLSNPAGSGIQLVSQGGGTPDDVRVSRIHELKAENYTAVAGDRSKVLEYDSVSTNTLTLTAAATLLDGWFISVYNSGTGIVIIDPTGAELINDLATITIASGQSATIICDGAAFWAIGRSSVQIVRKTSDETVNNSTTLQNDDQLFVVLAANEIIFFQCLVIHIGNTTADFKLSFTVPSGAALLFSGPNALVNTSDALALPGVITASGTGFEHAGSTSDLGQLMVGVVRNGATPGNLQLQWAQVTATVVDTKVLTDSFLMVWRV